MPVKTVDIIVSEWMGYGLLYEAMLESVVWARDRYLKSSGLMVPGHSTLRIAPISDLEDIDSTMTFWQSVYGFDMTAMIHDKVYDEARVLQLKASQLCGESSPFLHLPHHTHTAADLSFVKKFEFNLTEDIESLNAFVVWFDTYFHPKRTSTVPYHTKAEDLEEEGFVAFTTGPAGAPTHWQQVVLLINRRKTPGTALKAGQVIVGDVQYQKSETNQRALEIGMTWEAPGTAEKGHQLWSLE